MKHLWIWMGLLASPLLAETIGDYVIEFPPSNNEWKLLLDQTVFSFIDDEEEGIEAQEETDNCLFKAFTHREGDALEVFSTMILSESADENEEEEGNETLEMAQKILDDQFGKYFPNHRMVILDLKENDQDRFIEWEWNDGVQDILHGYTRFFQQPENYVFFSYFTTAPKSEYNRLLWIQTLNSIQSAE